ncbi:ABC transporter ATP-binding protein [Mycoplasma sp. 4044]
MMPRYNMHAVPYRKISYWKEFKKMIKYFDKNELKTISIFFVSLLSAAVTVLANFLVGKLIDKFFLPNKIAGFDQNKFIIFLIYLAICYILGQAFILIINWFSAKMAMRAAAQMRLQSYKNLMKMPLSYFETKNSGQLMSTLTNDIDNVAMGLMTLISQAMITINFTIICLIAIFVTAPFIGLFTVALIPVLYTAMFLFIKFAMPAFHQQQISISMVNGFVEEIIKGQNIITSFNRQEEMIKRFKVHNDNLVKPAMKAGILGGITYPYSNLAAMILRLAVISLAAFLIMNNKSGGNGVMTLGALSAVNIYLVIFTNQFIQVMNVFSTIQMAVASSSRISEMMVLKPEIDNSKLLTITDIKGDIKFENVDFSYTNDPENLQLKKASFWAKKGQSIAIVGPTGAGKTTIVNLLSKFYQPLGGKILVDDRDLTQYSEESWRDNISVVLQDTFLFKGTIKENLRYGNLKATDEEIHEAAKLAHADEFIQKLEHGYDTVIDQSGSNLSQGERQLIAIARAILSNKDILILDEATSNVDVHTEKNIQKAMLNLMKGKTSFIIAHRLSTIVNSTCILVVDKGQIVEKGNHQELLALKGMYEKMYHSNFEDND